MPFAAQKLAAAAAAAVIAVTSQGPVAFAAGGLPQGYDFPLLCDSACTAVRYARRCAPRLFAARTRYCVLS